MACMCTAELFKVCAWISSGVLKHQIVESDKCSCANTNLDFRHGDGDVSGLHGELHTLPLVGGKPLGFSCSLTAVLARTPAQRSPEGRGRKAVKRKSEAMMSVNRSANMTIILK